MPNQAIVDAVRRSDWDAINASPADPARLAEDLEAALPRLDDEGSQIAAMLAVRHPGPRTAHFMLLLVRSKHLQAAAEAAVALGRLPVAVADIAAALPEVRDPMVRAPLYLALGRSSDAAALPALRKQLALEHDASAAAQGQAAAARLGGTAERGALLERVQRAGVADAKEIYDELIYVGDARFARGLLPWLDNHVPVTRIGRDADGATARLCDLAVWTAQQLGVALPGSITRLERFDDATLAATRAALQSLAAP